MHKQELIEKLKSRKDFQWKGQEAFAAHLAYFLENLEIPQDTKYDFWRIEPYLVDICVDAFEQMRISDDPQVIKFRKQYEAETGREVPVLLDLGASYILDQGAAVQTTIGFLLKDVLGEDYITSQVDAYCNAQKYVLQQSFDKFLRQVYRQGMFELIQACDQRGMSANFGDTTLMTYVMCGRVMLTFEGRDGQVSFVVEEGDPLCYSGGLQSIEGDLFIALGLINDVINHWPDVKKAGTFVAKRSA